MQDVAREMNLSETAFLVRRNNGFDLRWCTPAVEVDLCGHATLASAHVLWEDGHLAGRAEARFHTKSGVLTADRRGAWIEMDFPATPPEPKPAPRGLAEAIGVTPRFVGRTRFDYLLEVADEDMVRHVQPDFAALARVEARGVIVTSRAATSDYDFVSRFFAPRSGVAEDPVTGSAHCALAPYWVAKLGKAELVGYQASPGGSMLTVNPVVLEVEAPRELRWLWPKAFSGICDTEQCFIIVPKGENRTHVIHRVTCTGLALSLPGVGAATATRLE